VVIFLDEAQGLGFELLEGLRLLSNLETEDQKLIQIVLFAQTELEERLQERGLRQVDQRILVRYRLLPLEPEEIQPYIHHQLKVANLDTQVELRSNLYKPVESFIIFGSAVGVAGAVRLRGADEDFAGSNHLPPGGKGIFY